MDYYITDICQLIKSMGSSDLINFQHYFQGKKPFQFLNIHLSPTKFHYPNQDYKRLAKSSRKGQRRRATVAGGAWLPWLFSTLPLSKKKNSPFRPKAIKFHFQLLSYHTTFVRLRNTIQHNSVGAMLQGRGDQDPRHSPSKHMAGELVSMLFTTATAVFLNPALVLPWSSKFHALKILEGTFRVAREFKVER